MWSRAGAYTLHMDSPRTFFMLAGASALGSIVALALAYGLFMRVSDEEVADAYPACNVLAVQVHGFIVATPSQIPVTDYLPPDGSGVSYAPNYVTGSALLDTLERATLDESIRAIILDIDSPGGSSATANEVADAVGRLGKPSLAVIHDLGLSGGYLIAASSDLILANKNSTVGSIGATYSYISDYEKSEKEGLAYVQLSSGPYKDMLSPSKELTDDERALVERDLATLHADFVATVARMRDLPEEEVARLADGSSLLGTDARSAGLVDELGGTHDAISLLEEELGEPVTVCWQ